MVNLFQDNFWDEDFNGTAGYDALIERLKDGKQFLDVFIDFLKNRSKLEEDYGKNLTKLAQTSLTHNEIGTLNASWDAVRKESENVGKVHCELAKKLNELIERAQKFRETQKCGRHNIDDKIKKCQKEKKAAYDNMLKNKKLYEQRCRDSEQSKEAFESKSMFTTREEERLHKNMAKTKTLVENTDSAYQSSVKILEDCRKKWELEMEDACAQFQSFEVERIQYIRNEMWVYTNLGTLQVIEISTRYEDCRSVLEKCDATSDIQFFIFKKRTGSERPAPIPYENFYHTPGANQISQNLDSVSVGRSSGLVGRGSAGAATRRSIEDHIYVDPFAVNTSNRNGSVKNKHGHPTTWPQPGCTVKVIYPYTAQGPEELTLKVGEIIKVSKIEDQSWGLGEINGRFGAFPRAFVETT